MQEMILQLSALVVSIAFCASFSLRTHKTKTSAIRLFDTPQEKQKMEFDKAQWDLLLKNHVGEWLGLQTGYDPANDEVADYMYVVQSLKREGDYIKHVNSMVAGEIRADCETCFDSERLRSKDVATYQQGKLRARYLSNVELRGPAPTARGMSTELAIRHENGRIHVLFAYSPSSFQNIGGVQIPAELYLKDIVVTRERLAPASRPLQLENNPDEMWGPVVHELWDSLNELDGVVHSVQNGKQVSNKVQPLCRSRETEKERVPTAIGTQTSLLSASDIGSKSSIADGVFKRSYRGGVAVRASVSLKNGESGIAHVAWQTRSTIYTAEIELSVLDEVFETDDSTIIVSPPRLLAFKVFEFNH